MARGSDFALIPFIRQAMREPLWVSTNVRRTRGPIAVRAIQAQFGLARRSCSARQEGRPAQRPAHVSQRWQNCQTPASLGRLWACDPTAGLHSRSGSSCAMCLPHSSAVVEAGAAERRHAYGQAVLTLTLRLAGRATMGVNRINSDLFAKD